MLNIPAMAMKDIAEDYLLANLSVIPVSKDKRATFKWETFQRIPLEVTECDRVFSDAWGLAIISGAVSGGFEVIDFDAHNKDIDSIFNQFIADEGVAFILSRYNPPIERSPRGGYHIIYRYEADSFEGNRKLANWADGESMIETRGEGGYTVVFPSPNYTMVSGSLLSIPSLTLDQRNYLVNFAVTFNQGTPKKTEIEPNKTGSTDAAGHFHNTDPVSYFNWNCQSYAKKLLEDKGWKKLSFDEKEDIEYWQRPGKEGKDHSATWGKKHNSLYVFSSSASPFKNECYYSPFQILVLLRFNGSYQPAILWILFKYLNEADKYIRVGTNYFKIISKTDRFGLNRTELKVWTERAIFLDHGKPILNEIKKFDDFTILPDNLFYSPVVNNCYNLYRPFTHQPSPGTWDWTEVLIRHIFGEQYDLGIRYLQILYLHPERLMPILVMVSRQRQTGKTTFLNWLNMIFGDNMAMVSPDDLINGFNSTYAGSNIIAVEETLIEKAITVEKIKALATSKFISINQKFVSQSKVPFFGKIILTSNNEDKFARIDDDEIRFFIRKVKIPTIENHNIEADMVAEIPAFLHHLTTLPPVNFSHDRTGFTPAELQNTSLSVVKDESKSGLYRSIQILVEDLFLNERSGESEFYADAISIKNKFFLHDSKIDLAYIRNVLKNEFSITPAPKMLWFHPFTSDPGKNGRPYTFKREFFTSSVPTISDKID
ncbi:MAG: DUF5906 domain-containing protein, partial [Bacteroidota bacterium]